MKDFLIKYLTVFIFAIQASLCYKEVRDYFGINSAIHLIWVVGILCLVFIINYYFTFLKPYKRFLRFEDSRERILNSMAEEFLETFKKEKITLRLNIMLIERRFISNLEPGKIFGRNVCFFRMHLVSRWVSRNMDHAPDRGIVLTIKQGVAGKAVIERKPILNFPQKKNQNSYNLNLDQQQKVTAITAILSFPIREIDMKTKRITNNIIGVLNVDSTSPKSVILNENPKLLDSLTKKTQGLAENCALIF